MSPLALRVLRTITTDPNGEGREVFGAHTFECSDLALLAYDFAKSHFPQHADPRLMFLPSPNTWIEYACPFLGADIDRRGFLLRDIGEDGWISLQSFLSTNDGRLICSGADKAVRFRLGAVGECFDSWRFSPGDPYRVHPDAIVAGFLTIVNQPRGVRKEIMAPHRGLRKTLARAGLLVEPNLRPWTKLVLDGQVDAKSVGASEAGKAGFRKCYHFVRAHFRAANGQFVRAHFRGDPSLGVGRKTYEVRA